MSHTRRRFLVSAILAGVAVILISPPAVDAQGMSQVPGMGDAKQEKTVSATGTIAAINTADRRITLNNGPIPELTWPAMTMEFPVLSSVDLSRVKVGDKVRFAVSGGSGNVYTVQSIDPAP